MRKSESEDHVTFRVNKTAISASVITGVVCFIAGMATSALLGPEADTSRAECQKQAVLVRDRCMNSGLSGLRKNPQTIEKCEEVYQRDLARCGE